MPPYDIRVSARAQAMRVSVYPDGAVRITVPQRAPQVAIDRFIARYASWIERARAKSRGARVINAEKKLIKEYKKQAEHFARERCAYYAARFGVHFNKIAIRAQKRRWGSCSRKGNLSFNYKIALLPTALAEYVVVHEICHLARFDHSRAFWALVERDIPDHKRLRKELRSLVFRFS